MFLFYQLNKSIFNYLGTKQRSLIADAFIFSANAHENQIRSSGDPYFTHPFAVACFLAGMKLDMETIIAALLHDVLEDTEVTEIHLLEYYGDKVMELVKGVTKLTKIEFRTKAEQQAENLRKMILAMVKDVRVILIKLADRLHNMETLSSLRPDKCRRISRETIEIYAPIAHRLGMHNIKNILEDLSFKGIYPYRYRTLKTKVKIAQKYRKKVFNKILEKLKQNLCTLIASEENIIGRKKRLYSIYRKMRDRDMSFSEIMDIYAFKVITNSDKDCYVILGEVHKIFRPVPGRIKDYIATPKANGYQSLHTTVFGPYGVPIEVQIKTKIMNDTAEKGIAAHWIYKSKCISHNNAQKWLNKLSELQRNVTKSTDFIESVKLDLFPDEVYVFTPNGEIIELPIHATCIDFAYNIHTDIGNYCVAAKVNRRMAALNYVLKHGDTVEIITSPTSCPNLSWLDFVNTARAKHAIKNSLKKREQFEILNIGKQTFEQCLTKVNLRWENIDQKITKMALLKFNFNNLEELHKKIGQGEFSPNNIILHILDYLGHNLEKSLLNKVINIDHNYINYLANCCMPIPGDTIAGILESKVGFTVHNNSCSKFISMANKDNVIDVQWKKDIKGVFKTELLISFENIKGAITKVTSCITRQEGHIISLNFLDKYQTYITIKTIVEVSGTKHLSRIIKLLKRLTFCTKVKRSL